MMKVIYIEISNKERAKELKNLFSSRLGFNVNLKTGSGSMKCYYGLNAGKKRNFEFTKKELEIIIKTLIQLDALDIFKQTFDKIKYPISPKSMINFCFESKE